MKTLNLFAQKAGFSAATLLSFLLAIAETSPAKDAVQPAESASLRRLTLLVDSAPYSQIDKETLKAGLLAAAPYGSGSAEVADYVSEKTIDVQVKNTSRDLSGSITFLFDVTKCLQQNRAEFLNGPQFERVPEQERAVVSSYLNNIVEQYSARTLEALFAQHGRTVKVPDDVERSVTNAAYRQLLMLTARTLQQPTKAHAGLPRTPTHHTVRIGDSLATVARLYQVSPDVIVKANPGLVPGHVRVGQIIYIPAAKAEQPVLRATAAPEKTVSLNQPRAAN